jgi:hypothetical protein
MLVYNCDLLISHRNHSVRDVSSNLNCIWASGQLLCSGSDAAGGSSGSNISRVGVWVDLPEKSGERAGNSRISLPLKLTGGAVRPQRRFNGPCAVTWLGRGSSPGREPRVADNEPDNEPGARPPQSCARRGTTPRCFFLWNFSGSE